MISLTPIKHGVFFKSSKYIYSSHIEQYKILLQLDLEIVEKDFFRIIMRLKFEARKVEVDTGNNALGEINWTKIIGKDAENNAIYTKKKCRKIQIK